ncbi:MAG TPA: cytochrome c oxidase assembly protein [Dehalococcoidia bacterium]|jgi:cytochrome c oxidase assembly factor CtaG|nr:cytochrome c oxidase assembly protein [Dehalococcoidia bacterium]HIK89890.1 cytochrome c oxidase assembly protein [Dehalococcoidia bacterium]
MNGGSEPNLINSFGEFASAWDFSSPPAVLFLLLAGAYLTGSARLALRSNTDNRFWSKLAAGVGGFVLLAIALAGPFDFYSGDMFTMHMSQHVVIAMFAAPLLLIAQPMPAYIWALPRPIRIGVGTALTGSGTLIKALRVLTRPTVALPLFIGTLYAWHIPAAYNGSLENEWLHLFMHFTMFTTAVFFWWPIVGPPPIRTQLNHPRRIIYLLLAVTPTALMAAIITLSNSVIYDFYLDSPGHFGWNPVEDQSTGGLIMWIPGNFVYLATLTVLFFQWFSHEERKSGHNRR